MVRQVDISMPRYVNRALLTYAGHPLPHRTQHSPHPWTKPNYGAKQQLTEESDNYLAITPTRKTRIQQIIGTLLYYGRAVYYSILPCLGTLGNDQANPTEKTESVGRHLLAYLHT